MATATKAGGLRDRLKDIRANVDELRNERKSAADEQKAAQEAYAGLDDLKPGSPEFETAKAATAKVGEIDDQIASWQAEEISVLEMLGQSRDQIAHDLAPGNERRTPGNDQPAAGWDSAKLFADDDLVERLRAAAHSKGRFGGIELGEVADRDTFAADVAPTSNMRRGEYYGVVPQLFRPLRVLDLLPTGTMDQNTFPYTQESGALTGAAETTEGNAKPEGAVTYTDAEATARTIAAWLKLKRQALADIAALRGTIDQRLRYMVQRRLEGQALNGDGADPNIRGILQTSGIGTVPFDGGQLPADQILTGITTVLLADAMADGIIMHPTDWQTVLKAKAGDGHYYSGGPFSMTPQVLWGIPLIPSPAIPVGHALVGDFSIGALLLIREGVNVLMSDSDQDDFIKNRITLLGEMRAALAVWRPAAFTDVDLAA
jgi:hypothetical protein